MTMKNLRSISASYGPVVVVAAVMSYLSSRIIFVGSGLNLIPWGLIAIACGASSANKSVALRRGALYGFCQSFIFLWIDKHGMTSFGQFLALSVIITGLSLLAAGCAWLGAYVGWTGRKLMTRA